MAALRKTHVTPEEYLALDRASEVKHEYIGGQVYAMSGASRKHNLIVTNLIRELSNKLRRSPCEVYPGDMRVLIPYLTNYLYPDVTVVCGEPQFVDDADLDTLINPVVVIEVLSDSTEKVDRGKKFDSYRRITSLQEYLLVSQDEPHVERLARQPNGDWTVTVFDRLADTARLVSVDATLALAEIYDRVPLSNDEE